MGGNYNWPEVETVKEYRKKVRDFIRSLIDRTEIKLPVTWNDQEVFF